MRRLYLLPIIVTLAGAPSAFAESRKAEAADQGLGMALMSAYVASDGTLIRGVGATSAVRDSTGIYKITFVRDIESCTDVASVQVGVGPGNARPDPTLSAGEVLRLATEDSNGVLADRDFSVLVFCAN